MNIVNCTAANKSNVPVLAVMERYANEKKIMYANRAITDRQLAEPRLRFCQRGSIITAKVTAPERTLTDVKLAASMRCWPNASLQISGLAAKAIMATTVRDFVLATAVTGWFDPESVTHLEQPVLSFPHYRSPWPLLSVGRTLLSGILLPRAAGGAIEEQRRNPVL